MADKPKGDIPGGRPGRLTKSTFIPILANPGPLAKKGYLIPAAITGLATVALFVTVGSHQLFFLMLSAYVTFIQCLIVYFLCGRRHIWIPMIMVFCASFAILGFTHVFDVMRPYFASPEMVTLEESSDYGSRALGHFVAVGLLEELFKALPLLALAILGVLCTRGLLPAPLGVIALREPLDGIALGVSSGAGFAVVESLVQYVPEKIALTGSQLQGYELLLGRLISQLGGHLGFSGIFGYFIGMAVLKPKAAPVFLALGWATAAAFHAAWNATALGIGEVFVNAAVIIFLVAAILKARRISPSRGQNFATVTIPAASIKPSATAARPRSATGTAERSPAETSQQSAEHEMQSARPQAAGATGLLLRIGPLARPLGPGVKIEPRHLGAAGAGRGRGPIAEAVTAPSRPGELALRNLGDRPWRAELPTGATRDVAQGQTLALAPGLVIDFGGIEGIVQGG